MIVYLFTTITEEREDSEWGIRAWVPAPFKTRELGPEEIEIFYPRRFAGQIKVPFIFYIRESGKIKAVYCEGNHPASGESFFIKQGEGSVNLSASAISDKAEFIIGGKKVTVPINKISESYIELKGTINKAEEIPANSLVHISGNLDITSTGSLTVHEGALILIDEAVDINVSGPIIFSGSPLIRYLLPAVRKINTGEDLLPGFPVAPSRLNTPYSARAGTMIRRVITGVIREDRHCFIRKTAHLN